MAEESVNTTWHYKGIANSQRVSGDIEAAGRQQAILRLRQQGIMPTDLVNSADATGLNMELSLGGGRYPKKKDYAVMARQLATMVAAGVPLVRSLNIVTDQVENKRLRDALRQCVSDVENGSSFSEAMERNEDDLFPPIMVHMVRAGEAGGFLDGALLTIADSFEADVRLQQQIKSAMAYPIVVLCIAILLVGVMLVTIVPTFKDMYDSMGAKLPGITMVLVKMGDAAPIAIPLIIVAVVAFAIYWRSHRNKMYIRQWWEPFKLRVPVFGKLNNKVCLARFCRNFSSMLSSGVPILEALDIVGSTSGNIVYENASKNVAREVEKGTRLSDAMGLQTCFPNMMVQMVAIGEDAGAIDQMLASAGKAYDEEVQATAKSLTSLLEPVMILVLGAIVGFMVLALYMPMFSMYDAIQNM
ncbi:MAG: type II secretion system F family protein [Bifidobacteriaceae bacterium]|nr:type II secretion system F family protein [Bifidobacteriaceae bacterium]